MNYQENGILKIHSETSAPAGLPELSNNFNFTMRKKTLNKAKVQVRSTGIRRMSDLIMEVGVVASVKGKRFLVRMYTHTSTQSKKWTVGGRVRVSHLCALSRDGGSDPHCAPRHLCTRASLAHTDSVTDPRIL